MERITRRHLEGLCKQINEATGSPATPWEMDADGHTIRANIGNYLLGGTYGGFDGGWNLERIRNESGEVENVFGCGHIPARDLYNRMRAYLEGLRFKA